MASSSRDAEELLDELLDCTRLSNWELDFVEDMDRMRQSNDFTCFTPNMIAKIQEIYDEKC